MVRPELRDLALLAGTIDLDPHHRLPVLMDLLVQRWAPAGYVVILRATSGEVVRAEPFDTIDLVVAELFGDD